MDGMSEADLYHRGCETLLASWEAYARGAAGAAVRRLPGVVAAVFPIGPEREVYNNALLQRGLGAGGRADALDAMADAYATAGVLRFAGWVHERDEAICDDLVRRGYTVDTTTRAMGMALDEHHIARPEIPLGPADWSEYLAYEGLSADFLRHADHAAFHVLVNRAGNVIVSAALAYDAAGDCGIYNVGTVPRARRRGLATAVTAGQLHQAIARGCRSASLQSTPMAEHVYAALGFRDLGLFLEFVPPATGPRR